MKRLTPLGVFLAAIILLALVSFTAYNKIQTTREDAQRQHDEIIRQILAKRALENMKELGKQKIPLSPMALEPLPATAPANSASTTQPATPAHNAPQQ